MSPQCQHCGAEVSQRYARVFGDENNEVHRCLHCDSLWARKQGSTAGKELPMTTEREHYGEYDYHGLQSDARRKAPEVTPR